MRLRFVLLSLSLVLISGCPSDGGIRTYPAPPEPEQPSEVDTTSGVAKKKIGSFRDLTPEEILSIRVLYFDYNSADIREKEQAVAQAHGQFLATHPNARVILEGHADERGTRGYNLALGERRAKSIQNILTILGASPAQIQVISYGEERPASFGQNEESWGLNRRVEIIYRDE